MIDCPNADIRDQLPDLVSGVLSGSARATVQAHVDGCADCRAEVALITNVRRVLLADAPGVDAAHIQTIVAAIAAPSARDAVGIRRAKRGNRIVWRIAATVVFMAVGGTVVVLQSGHRGVPGADSAAIRASQAPAAAEASPELALPGNLDSLSTDQLKSLLTKIDHLDGLPPAVPDSGDPPTTADGSGGSDTVGDGSRMIRS